MTVHIKSISEKNLDDHPCFRHGDEEAIEKTKQWLRKVFKKFGSCAKIAYIDGKPVGMIQYAPMDIFPHVVSSDAHRTILIHCVYVPDEKHKRKGIATTLMNTLIQDLKKPHLYLNGGRFEKIMVLAGRNRPGPAGPEEFFRKIGFVEDRQISEEDVLMQMRLDS